MVACWSTHQSKSPTQTDRKPISRETMRTVRSAENNGTPQLWKKWTTDHLILERRPRDVWRQSNQTSLHLISPLGLSRFISSPLTSSHRHPIWGSPTSGDQEGADAGCWREAQYWLTGGKCINSPILTKQNQNSFILQNAPDELKKQKHFIIENLKIQWRQLNKRDSISNQIWREIDKTCITSL